MEVIKEGYTRVSEILSIFQAYSFIPKEKLRKACELGTDIHEAIEAYFKGEFTPLSEKKSPYFESFLKWVEQIHPVPICQEKRFYSDSLMVTGKLDLIANIGEEAYIIDFKTGSWSHPEIWKLQLHFYALLMSMDCNEVIPEKFMIVHLKKEGIAPDIYTFSYEHQTTQICLKSLECYRFFKNALVVN